MKIIAILASVLLCFNMSFAKKKALPTGPFSLSGLLSQISTLQLSTAEISAFMPNKNMLFVVGDERVIEIVDLKNPIRPQKIGKQKIKYKASSVSVNKNLVAVSMLHDDEYKNGYVQIFSYDKKLESIATVEVCSQPDMLTFTPDGFNLLVACEGSPNDDFSIDPEGGVAILSVNKNSPDAWKHAKLDIARFNELDSNSLMAAGVRKFGPHGFLRSLEPEYITVDKDSKTAWISLQENNAIATLDIAAKRISGAFALGFVNHLQPGFGLDAVKNGIIEIKNYPLRGLRQPDGIASFNVDGKNYLITANEGAPVNDYDEWTDETDVDKLDRKHKLDRSVFTDSLLYELHDLTVSDIDGCNEILSGCPYMYTFGSRSISIFDCSSKTLLWDSGEQLESAFAKIAPDYFNWNSKKGKVKMDSRSSDKGPEPENVTVGIVENKRYAFAGLERTSGIATFDITNLNAPKLVDLYFNPLDRGPEGLLFIPAEISPLKGTALLVVGYEYSKTLTIYSVK